jgi:hypothetical protein
MVKATALLVLKAAAGLLVAGAVIGILVPLLPGMIESWMVGVIVLLSVGAVFLATWRKTPLA